MQIRKLKSLDQLLIEFPEYTISRNGGISLNDNIFINFLDLHKLGHIVNEKDLWDDCLLGSYIDEDGQEFNEEDFIQDINPFYNPTTFAVYLEELKNKTSQVRKIKSLLTLVQEFPKSRFSKDYYLHLDNGKDLEIVIPPEHLKYIGNSVQGSNLELNEILYEIVFDN